jgi:hypothetical protein
MKCDSGCVLLDFVAAGFMCVGLILFTLADSQVIYFFVNFKYKICLKFSLFFLARKVELRAVLHGNFPFFCKIFVPIMNKAVEDTVAILSYCNIIKAQIYML